MLAPGHAAGDLDIDQPVATPIACDHFCDHSFQRGTPHRRTDAQFGQAPLQPVEMQSRIHGVAAVQIQHFIDPVGELIAAVFYVNAGPGVGKVEPVDIGDATHRVRPGNRGVT